jgi:hypothetical protein
MLVAIMSPLTYLVDVLAVICVTTPAWYFPYRRLIEHLGYSRYKSGRVRQASLVDWLCATGIGIFVGSLLLPLTHLV